jgi:hypothetical protein
MCHNWRERTGLKLAVLWSKHSSVYVRLSAGIRIAALIAQLMLLTIHMLVKDVVLNKKTDDEMSICASLTNLHVRWRAMPHNPLCAHD